MIGFLALGVGLRLLRFGMDHPLWRDEAYLAANLLERDFAGLTQPLDFQQVCPLLFLWTEKAMVLLLGFSEWSLRIVPTIASIASLFLIRHVARRLSGGIASVLAVATLAIAYTPIRHGGEVKPYATDFLVALVLLALAIAWLQDPGRVRSLWGLAIFGPVAVGVSNPAIFVAASVGLVLSASAIRSGRLASLTPLVVFGLGTGLTFLLLLRFVNGPQGAHVMSWMRVYWARSFPPASAWKVPLWLAEVHTSYAFAYPAGGASGASALTTACVAAGIVAVVRRGSKPILAVLLMPFALGLLAALLGRYPYGGSARTMQYLAPMIILLASLGAAGTLDRLPQHRWRDRAAGFLLGGFAVVGIGMGLVDLAQPYKEALDQTSRDFARRFWAEESRGAKLFCARTDLHWALDPLTWQGDRAAVYLCYQAINRHRHPETCPGRLDSAGRSPLVRVVVFGETPTDRALAARWIDANAGRFRLLGRRERILNKGRMRGKARLEEKYVVYDLVPTNGPVRPAP